MFPIVWLVRTVVELFSYALIIYTLLSTLASFGIVNARHSLVASILEFLYKITEPLLAPIRKRLPYLGAIDLSPLVLLLLLQFIVVALNYYVINY